MRDPRRSTGIVPRSSPRTTALRPAGRGFAGKVFVTERRIGRGSSGGRAVRLVGEFELWGYAPESLVIVVASSWPAAKKAPSVAKHQSRHLMWFILRRPCCRA